MFLSTPSFKEWLAIFFVSGPIMFLLKATYNLYFHPLAHIPGPFWARASGFPSYWQAKIGKRHIWLWQQFQIYGDRIRVSPDVVLFCDPDAYLDIFSVRANVRKSDFYTAFVQSGKVPSTLGTVDVAEHAAKRKLLSMAFTEKSLRASASFISNHIDRWNELMLEENPDTVEWSKSFDLSERLDQLTVDIMGDLSFGKSFNIKEPGDNPLKTVPRLIAGFLRFYYPLCRSPFLPVLLWLRKQGLIKALESSAPPTVQQYRKFVRSSIADRIALHKEQQEKPEAKRRQDIFYFLCESRDPDTGEVAFNEEALLSESTLLIIAGTDTTAISLSGIWFYLTGDPRRCQKLVDEIRSTFNTPEDIVYDQKLLSCVYLRACIDEGMRMTPTGPCELPRQVLPGGQRVLGEFYPPGTILGVVPWCMSFSESIYEDATVFRPERWIVDEANGVTKESVDRLKANFHPFLSGVGSCLGKNIAMAEMMLTVARTLHRLDIRRTPGSTLGCGGPEQGWGARNKKQYQLVDAYVSLRQGPEVQFRKRAA
ncbi:benzoate 4-monooxygenase cytochrome P450 [Stachybotrys elegans]|uniref:Benzoate 4-monooxygenase cytochrome P450 n=1 Tax=Stachybotrys elegans TaxID=80388 RepID=A0A8K0SES0_9HYPO|nr:benzoate 4-monooxygenase cytochrome P450 [Stachybotrys elegans]